MRSGLRILFLFFLPFCSSAQKTGTVSGSDGSLIYYRTYGSGNPLLIINGGPGMNSDGFENLAIILSKNYKTIIYDQRGTGRSKLLKVDSTTITMKLMIEDIEILREHLKLKTWSVLGHSFGGMLASYYATKFPTSIEKIVLSSSGGIDLELLTYVSESINSKLSKAALDSINYWNTKISEGDTSHYTKLQRGKLLAPAYVLDKKYIPVIAERLTQSNMQINQLIWADLIRIHFDCSSHLALYAKPVLIIQGKEDIIKPQTAEKAHKILKNSKLVLMNHCIHYGWLDNEEVYFKELLSFLG